MPLLPLHEFAPGANDVSDNKKHVFRNELKSNRILYFDTQIHRNQYYQQHEPMFLNRR